MGAIPITQRPMAGPPKLPPELEEKLKAPLPKEAVRQHPTKKDLSVISPAYVTERMNEVFGIGGYHITAREIGHEKVTRVFKKDKPDRYETTQYIGTVHVALDIPEYGIHLEHYGGSENDDLGDAFKGAVTDAFTKMCSMLGVGLEVYKGKHKAEDDSPACPNCGVKALTKSKFNEPGREYFCFQKKGGCGINISASEYEQLKIAPRKPPASSQPVQPDEPPPAPPEKITVEGTVSECNTTDQVMFLKVGLRNCATKDPNLWKRLNGSRGKQVELLVSAVETKKWGTLWQIHKVLSGPKAVQP